MVKGKPPRKPRTVTGRTGFSRYIRLRNGRILDAYAYGHKAWPIGKRK